jgi:hypothetical protein
VWGVKREAGNVKREAGCYSQSAIFHHRGPVFVLIREISVNPFIPSIGRPQDFLRLLLWAMPLLAVIDCSMFDPPCLRTVAAGVELNVECSRLPFHAV